MFKSVSIVSLAMLGLLSCVAVAGPEIALLPPPPPHVPITMPHPLHTQSGAELYQAACAACHGKQGLGIPHMAKDLVHSRFVHSTSETDLVHFLKVGRTLADPMNTTGVTMPPQGGAQLTDNQLRAIVRYVRTLKNVRVGDRAGESARIVPEDLSGPDSVRL